MNLLIQYGWYALLFAIAGDMFLPFILTPFYKGYSNTLMSVSVLGNPQSPVRVVFNLWMLLEGILFLAALPALYHEYAQTSKLLAAIAIVFIAVFAVGACIFTCFFSANETREEVTPASQIHGVGSVAGFVLLLFVPLLLARLSFLERDKTAGIVFTSSFLLAFLSFALFVMADKPRFAETILTKEGLWQRLALLFMYLPLGYCAVKNILG